MAQLNDVQPLEDALAALLQQLSPPARRTLMREVAKTLRQRQKKQIQAQKNPDGSPYIPRKRRVRDKHGRLRRKMFTRLHTARFMKTASTPESASVSFTPACRAPDEGASLWLARSHQPTRSDGTLCPSSAAGLYQRRP